MEWREVSTDRLDEALAHFGGLTAAGQAKLCELIQEVDARQSWMSDGARSLSDWVSARLSLRHETARQLTGVARRLADLPILRDKFRKGELSLDEVDAISKIATPRTEAGLIEEAMGLSNPELDRMARRSNPPNKRDERSVWERRAAYLQWNLDESELRLRANMPAAEGQIVQEAMESAAERVPVNPESGMFDVYPARLADGLVELCATTGDQTTAPPQITVSADLEALSSETDGVTELSSGSLVPNETARRLGCDAVVQTVIRDGHQTIGIGRNSRTVPGWLRRLLELRDDNRCQFPGCSSGRWLHAHHIWHWSQGGPTELDNLILICGHHHRFVHEHGWNIGRSAEGRFEFRGPDWRRYPSPRPDLHPRLDALVRST